MHSKKENTEETGADNSKVITPFSLNDLHDIKNISSPAFSPDGSKVLAVISESVISSNTYTDNIVLIDVKTGRMTTLTEGGGPCWAPDGKKIAYEGSDGDQSAIYMLDIETMEKKALVTLYQSEYFMGHLVEKNFAWSPDGKYIAYACALPVTQHKKSLGNARVVTRLAYKTKGGRGREIFADDQLTHIWRAPVAGGEPELLTDGNYNEHSLSWSPDNRHIAFISNRTKDPDNNNTSDLWSVNVETKEIKRLTSGPGARNCPRWSPDAQYIAYLGITSAISTTDSVSEDSQAYIIAADGKENRCLSKALDRRVENIQWSRDSGFLYFTAGDAGSTNLYRTSLQGEIKPIVSGDFCVREYSLDKGGKDIALIRTGITEPTELYMYTSAQPEPRRLTDLNAFVREERALSNAETFWFTSFDGKKAQGWLMKPHGFEKGKKFPLALVIHGGPHNMFGYEFEERMQLLTSHGFGVAFINPRGSHGYGQTFSSGCVLNWGGTDYKDLMEGIDYIISEHDWIDSNKLVVTGQSYGGFMTNWIITQTSRFKAAVVDGGISNLISFAGTSLYYLLMEAEFNGKPWENYPLLWQWSPLRNVKNVVTPTLFLHGDKDNEVPVSQAEEMFYALKDIGGVDTAFVRYLGEGHGWRPNLLPENRQDLLERMIDWFKTHLQ